MAGRQLPRRGGADSRDPRRSPARVLSPAAQAGGGPARGLSARLRTRLGLRRAHRQPVRSADAVPVRARLPARAAADDRRALGGRDHAAHRPGREPAALGRADRPAAARRARRPTRWPTGCSASAIERPSRRRRRCGASTRRPCRRPSPCSCVQRLRDQDPTVTPALRWLDERLAAQGTTADEIVREEHQRQGAMNVTVRNVITSMRLMSAVDWAEIFESVSLVDAALRAGSDFAEMDFPTRDRYRHAIEELARGSGRTELEVARRAIAAAAARRHASRRASGERPAAASRIPATTSSRTGGGPSRRRSDFAFRSTTGWFAPARRAGIVGYSRDDRVDHGARSWLCRCVALSRARRRRMASRPARAARPGPGVGRWPSRSSTAPSRTDLGPQTLPALELRDGVPASLRTMVVVPDAADDADGDRGADRAPRGALPGESGRRSPLRAALGLDGLRHRDGARRRRAARRRGRRASRG